MSSIIVAGEDANNVIEQAQLSNAEKEELLNAVDKKPKDPSIVDAWAMKFDIPLIARIQSADMYNPSHFVPEKGMSQYDKLRLQCVHIQIMRHLITMSQKTSKADSPIVIKDLDITIKKGELIGVCG